MNELQIFQKDEFGQIRTIEENGTLLFVASDVTTALGYKNTSKATNDHCRWVTKRYIPHPQSKIKQIEVNVIPKGDIYRLVANSELPGAEKFESWIFDEVIPQIHQTGGYIPIQENDSDEDFLARAVLVAQKTIEKKNTIIEQQQKRIEKDKPKVLYAEALEVSKECILVKEMANLLKQNGIDIGQNKFFEWLRANGYLCTAKGERYNMPTQRAMDLKLFEIKKGHRTRSNGSLKETKTPVITGRGQVYFMNKFLGKSKSA